MQTKGRILPYNRHYYQSPLKTTSYSETPSLAEFFTLGDKALAAEIDAAQKMESKKRFPLMDGKRFNYVFSEDAYIYSFESETELSLPSDTFVKIYQDNRYVSDGRILSCEDFVVIVQISDDLGFEVDRIDFTVSSWELLERQRKSLEDLQDSCSPLVERLVCDGQAQIGGEIKKGQATAVRMATEQEITFIWGPPGTGKTTTFAQIALKHARKGNRVLMVSHSNAAVDGAALKTYELFQQKRVKSGEVVRYGYPHKKEVRENDNLTSFGLALKESELKDERDELLKERKKYQRTDERYKEITERLKKIRERVLECEKEIAQHARFIATTACKSVVDSAIYSQTFDVVIFDEASMAFVTQIALAAGLATRHFVCLGDFCQLPPITQSNTKFLKNDVFHLCGIDNAVQKRLGHNWLCLLDVQYRMHPDLAELVNAPMYSGLLKTAPKTARARQALAETEPFPEHALCATDMGGSGAEARKTTSGSSFNIGNAFVSAALAQMFNKPDSPTSVGVISPYAAQSRLLNVIARDFADETKAAPISCATVHKYQGAEKDFIIYDATAYGKKAVMLNSRENNYANRLFNVAVTRARGKFVAVGDIGKLATNLHDELIFSQLLRSPQIAASRKPFQEIIQDFKSDILKFFSKESSAFEPFLNDLKAAKKRVDIILDASAAKRRGEFDDLARILTVLSEQGVVVVVHAATSDALPSEIRKFTECSGKKLPVAVIDQGKSKVAWYGLFSKAANPLIFRYSGKRGVSVLATLLNLDTSDKSAPSNNE
ncbi:MAG: AAA family ATPase, partial [Thermoguttaceae bacterium]|nr:AAA family ATPase [Thermoguttaceae bacterium]